MAGPFESLFGDSGAPPYFGPQAGLDPSGQGYGAMNDGPEMLPWGVMAQPQQQEITAESMGLGPQNPLAFLQNATRGLFANPAAAQQQQFPQPQQSPGTYMPPRAAAQSGTLMGFLDTLAGRPTQEQLNVHESERLREKMGAAGSKILSIASELKRNSPDMPPAMLTQQLFKDPEFLKNIMQVEPQHMMKLVNDVVQGVHGKDEHITAPADSSVLVGNPSVGQPFKEVYRTPKTLRPGEITRAQGYRGDDPRLRALGIEGTKPDQMYEVKYARDAEGKEYVKDIGAVGGGVTVNMGDQIEVAELKRQVDIVDKIKQQQANAIQLARTANQIDKLVSANGASSIGPYGLITQIGQAAMEQASAIAQDSKLPFRPESYVEGFTAFKGLDKRAQNAAQVQSNILALAFMIARADNKGGPIAEKDVNKALTQIGGRFGSVAQLKAALPDIVGRAVTSIDDLIEIERGGLKAPSGKASVTAPDLMRDILTRNGLGKWVGPDRPARSPASGPEKPGEGEAAKPATGAQIPTGFTTKNKAGQTVRFKGGANVPSNWEVVP